MGRIAPLLIGLGLILALDGWMGFSAVSRVRHLRDGVYFVVPTMNLPVVAWTDDPTVVRAFWDGVKQFPSDAPDSRAVQYGKVGLIHNRRLINGTGGGEAIPVVDNVFMFQSGEICATPGA